MGEILVGGVGVGVFLVGDKWRFKCLIVMVTDREWVFDQGDQNAKKSLSGVPATTFWGLCLRAGDLKEGVYCDYSVELNNLWLRKSFAMVSNK